MSSQQDIVLSPGFPYISIFFIILLLPNSFTRWTGILLFILHWLEDLACSFLSWVEKWKWKKEPWNANSFGSWSVRQFIIRITNPSTLESEILDPLTWCLVLNCCKMSLSLSSLAWIVSLGFLVTGVRGQDGLRGLRTADEKPTNVSRSLSCFWWTTDIVKRKHRFLNAFSAFASSLQKMPKERRDAAGETLYKILMLGNSYTWQNNLTDQLQLLLQARAGISQESSVLGLHNGGLKIYDIRDKANTPGTAWYQNTQSNKDYDYVILQDQSIVPTLHGTTDYYEKSKSAAVELDQKFKAMGADTILYMTWGRRYGLADDWGNDSFLSMQNNLQVGYEDYANEIKRRNGRQAYMGPVGLAFKYLHDTDYEVFKSLYTGDNSHPSTKGTYVAACVFFSTITNQRCEGSPTSYGFDAALLRKLQKAADYASLDSRLSKYPLPTPKPPTHTPVTTVSLPKMPVLSICFTFHTFFEAHNTHPWLFIDHTSPCRHHNNHPPNKYRCTQWLHWLLQRPEW